MLGFAIAAPVGPIGILCIRRTVLYGRWSGLFSGLGAAVADTIYGLVAALGVTLISDFLLRWHTLLEIFGGIFLIYLGLRTFYTQPKLTQMVSHSTLIRDFVSTFFLTMTNPMTVLAYLAIFASLGLGHLHGNAAWLVVGVFIGSSLWWLILSEGVTLFRKKVSDRAMVWINRIAGLLIVAFGIVAIFI